MTMEQLNEAMEFAKNIEYYKKILKNLHDGCEVTIAVPEYERDFFYETIERRIRVLENTFDML